MVFSLTEKDGGLFASTDRCFHLSAGGSEVK